MLNFSTDYLIQQFGELMGIDCAKITVSWGNEPFIAVFSSRKEADAFKSDKLPLPLYTIQYTADRNLKLQCYGLPNVLTFSLDDLTAIKELFEKTIEHTITNHSIIS